jgi:hypothetical protein
MHVTTVAVSVNYSLAGARHSEPSAVEHGLPLLVVKRVLLAVALHEHLAVQAEEPPLLAEVVAQGY